VAIFKVELNQETYEKLVELALREWRPPAWHVEWLLTQAIHAAYAGGAPTQTVAPAPVRSAAPDGQT
jgi:hypothetical protein